MKNFTAKDYISDWYNEIPITIGEEQKNRVVDAIEKLLKNENVSLWLDIVRLHRGLEPNDTESINSFVGTFREFDGNFPLIKNKKLVHTLAGISLCFLLEQSASYFVDKICMALINTYIIEKGGKAIDTSINDYIIKYLKESDDRKIYDSELSNEEEIEDLIERLNDEDNSQELTAEENLSVLKSIKFLTKSNKLLSEETNILWWMFGAYSKVAGNSFKSIGATKMALYGAKELSSLTVFSTGLDNSVQLFNRVLIASNDGKPIKDSSIFEVVKSLSDEEKSILIGKCNQISNLTPCLLAIQRSQGNILTEEWSNLFKTNTGINLNKKLSLPDLANQTYKEFIFLKNLES